MIPKTLIKYKNHIDIDKLVYRNLLDNKAVLINNFPTEESCLIDFILKLGIPIEDFRNRGEAYFEVKVEGKSGFYSSYANCPYHFPLHTDCSDFEHIPNTICLFCVEPANLGGDSILTNINNIVQNMDADLKHFLLTHKFKMREKLRSILYKINANNFGIIYNRIILENFSKLTDNERMQLDKLDALINKFILKISLKKGDLLIVRNDTYLHGRTGFEENSKRLLRRIRFNI